MSSTPRKIQYYDDRPDRIWEYFARGLSCGYCKANVYHHEYDPDSNTIFCVCNGCQEDLYSIKDEYTEHEVSQGIWKEKSNRKRD